MLFKLLFLCFNDKKVSEIDQIMHDYTCYMLTLSYSEREGPHNSKGVVSGKWLCGVPLTSGFMEYPPLITVDTVCDLLVSMHNFLNY
jgi:hypothetical protein